MNNQTFRAIVSRALFPTFALLIAGLFIAYFANPEFLLSSSGFYSFLVYSLLSWITGLRYMNLICAITRRVPNWSISVTLPGSMGLMSFMLPFKGGGIWLLFYLRKAHGIGLLKGSWLALMNVIMAACLIVALVVSTDAVNRGMYSGPLAVFVVTYISTVLFALLFYNRIASQENKIRLRVALLDTAFSVCYLFVLFWLVSIVMPEESLHLQIGLVVLTISSMVIKLTPGNIGVFEGLALILMSIFPETGDRFAEYVATYRVLSLLHAGVVGVPSLLHLTDFESLRRLMLGRAPS